MDFSFEHDYDEAGNRWMITVSGEIDIFNSDTIKSGLMELISRTPADLFLDCKDLEYIDSTALGALVAVLKNVKNYDGSIHMANVRPSLAKLFKITNLDKVFILEGDANA